MHNGSTFHVKHFCPKSKFIIKSRFQTYPSWSWKFPKVPVTSLLYTVTYRLSSKNKQLNNKGTVRMEAGWPG